MVTKGRVGDSADQSVERNDSLTIENTGSIKSMTLAIAVEPAPIKTDDQGVVRVASTRVTLDTVVTAFLEGCTPEEIGEQYPSLHLPDIYLVIGYYLRHPDEVHAYLAERQHQSVAIREEVERRFNPVGIRDRLLARQNQSEQS